jgi:anaerobic selenocysteine-containing dehydrogenase
MSETVSRRNFLKLAGLGAAAAVLTGCGPAARYVTRRPYYDMPEYNQTGLSTYYATTCRECPAGCGLIMRTFEGRAIKAEGNPAHPVSGGKICSRGLTAVQGLYNPDRFKTAVKRAQRGDPAVEAVGWDSALKVVQEALNGPAEGVAFLLGLNQDHLADLVTELTAAIGAPAPLRYGALGMFEGRATLVKAAEQVFGQAVFPYFDLAGADLVISFGANFLETWLSPVAYSRGYSRFRKSGPLKKRGYLVSFEARRSLTSGSADEWYPVVPGSEGYLAVALGKLLSESGRFTPAQDYSRVDVQAACAAAGIALEKVEHLATLIAQSEHPVFLPGGNALGHAAGLDAAVNILALNAGVGNLGVPGGVFLTPSPAGTATMSELQGLVERMRAGQVSTLFIHGCNPVFELPPTLGFTQALANVKTVVSFASFPDETALQADWVLPDHTPLEGWGYQNTLAGVDRMTLSSAQPVVVPLYDTRASVDVLLSAGKLTYQDEVAFLQKALEMKFNEPSANIAAPDLPTLWAKYLQAGGWWQANPSLAAPQSGFTSEWKAGVTEAAEGKFHLIVFPTQMGDGSGANRPWLQETPDPATTVMWNSWIEINPHTAEELGLHDDDIVNVKSPAGEVEAVVYLYPAIRPDTVAIPFGQGHAALGRWAEGRGCNPAELLTVVLNGAGDQAFGDTLVEIIPTGKRRPIARAENRHGVYGDH